MSERPRAIRGDHFRDIQLDAFEAHGESLCLSTRGESAACAGLFPPARKQ